MPDSPNTVALQVTPADIPLIWMVETGAAGGSLEEDMDQLVLFPGKRSTSTIHLYNTSDRPLHLTLVIQATFKPLGYQILNSGSLYTFLIHGALSLSRHSKRHVG